MRDLFWGSVFRCAGGQGGLDHLADIEQLCKQGAMTEKEGGERGDDGIRRHVTNDGPLAMSRFDEARQLQHPDRVSDRRAADPEGPCELALGRKLLPGLEATVYDQPLDLLNDLFVDFGLPDWLELTLDRT